MNSEKYSGHDAHRDAHVSFNVQKPYLLILVNLQSNKRQKKETLRFPINISPTRISLDVKLISIP